MEVDRVQLTIDTLVRALEKLKDKHGNLPIYHEHYDTLIRSFEVKVTNITGEQCVYISK